MNLQVELNSLKNKKKMVEYKLSKLGMFNPFQKKELNARLVDLDKEIALIEKVDKLANSGISSKVD